MVDLSGVISEVNYFYSSFVNSLPTPVQNFVNLFLLVLTIVIYAVFIWKFYRFISRKNIFELNLSQYNKASNAGAVKVVATALYLLEYIVILPFLIFFWFAVFTFFLIMLTSNLSLHTILVIAVTIIAAVRMTAYMPKYGEDVAKEIAKLLPFTLLAVSLLNPELLSFEAVLGHLSEIPALSGLIFNYLLFIIVLEIILRLFEFFFGLFGLYDIEEEQAEKKRKESKVKEEN